MADTGTSVNLHNVALPQSLVSAPAPILGNIHLRVFGLRCEGLRHGRIEEN